MNMKSIRKYGIVAVALLLGLVSYNAYAQQTKTKSQDVKAETKQKEVKEITKAEFLTKVYDYEKQTEWKYLGDKPCILDFYASWCGPCRMLSPHLEELAKEYKGKINVYKINVDNERDLAATFGASSIPLIVFIPVDGQPQANRGYLPKDELKNAINSVLLKNTKKKSSKNKN